MPIRAFRYASAIAVLAFLTGCVTEPVDSASAESGGASTERSSSPVASQTRSESSRDSSETSRDRPSVAAADRRPSESVTRSEARAVPASDHAKLIEQLNEATRELATMRATNAKLRAEQSRPATISAEPAGRSDPSDDKLAATLKSYAQFKKEMTTFVAELERLRKENGERSGDYRDAAEQVRQAKAGVTRLETELRTEKKLRAEAEQIVTQLREQLRAVARAVSAAGGDVGEKRK